MIGRHPFGESVCVAIIYAFSNFSPSSTMVVAVVIQYEMFALRNLLPLLGPQDISFPLPPSPLPPSPHLVPPTLLLLI